jgi:NADH:ubiquinone oxidoreductase subunit 5 (subunit L)/multisubunit Na+/H+ antiporter MnhA subunit
MTLDRLLFPLLAIVLAGPALLGLVLLAGRQRATVWQPRIAVLHSMLVVAATALIAVAWARHGEGAFEDKLPPVLHLGHYQWVPMFLVDGHTLLYMVLVALVYPVVVRFSLPSFHREPGSGRYWFLVTLLGASLWLLCVAGNLDTLFVAWELVGVSSVMLIGFFRSHVRAAQNSLRALVYYRLGDFLILLAAVLIHHTFPDQRFAGFDQDVHSPYALPVALALLGGSLAKSAQLPMSPWLHRAMEGPAASSAIFYGALSVHLGPFLLLRTHELWLPSWTACSLMFATGLSTAVWATLVGRTRPDAKTALAYSTMAQIGIMYMELAVGLHTLVAIHLFAHAGLRTWQFLRSSSLIQDFQDNPVFAGSVTLQRRLFFEHVLPVSVQRRLYLAAVRLFWIDALQWHLVARPFLGLFRLIARAEDAILGRKGRGGAA